jgi:hypothetical protein
MLRSPASLQATSALDTGERSDQSGLLKMLMTMLPSLETEREVQKSLVELATGRSSLMIAHREWFLRVIA